MSISDVKGDHMDILFKNDDFVFSYRVGGILIHNEKILLQCCCYGDQHGNAETGV